MKQKINVILGGMVTFVVFLFAFYWLSSIPQIPESSFFQKTQTQSVTFTPLDNGKVHVTRVELIEGGFKQAHRFTLNGEQVKFLEEWFEGEIEVEGLSIGSVNGCGEGCLSKD